ncbi:MAG: hypothetical protein AAGE52_40725 [Myxococcota bacterium]
MALIDILRVSLGPWRARAETIAAVLADAGHDLRSLEASIRGPEPSGARMMVERVNRPTATRFLEAVDRPVPENLLAHAVPLIVGWDCAKEPLAKVYLNLSDRAESERRNLAANLGLSGAPHVVGVNIGEERTVWKTYRQFAGIPLGAPSALQAWATHVPVAGGVASYTLREGEELARAFFVAPRDDASLDQALHQLPNFEQAAEALPYPPGQVTSVGFDHTGTSWTVYVKPRSYDGGLWSVEPVVCLRRDDGELGIFLEPNSPERRAYSRSARHAISYRLRAGNPSSASVHEIMAWVLARVRQAETQNIEPVFDHPPGGWRVVAS